MIWNDTNTAVLRILASAEEPMTAIEIAEQLFSDTGIALHDDRVRNALKALEHNEGFSDSRFGLPVHLAVRAGKRGRSDLWIITPAGREEHARTAGSS
jgi:hypothetical protein